ncbi:MAG: YbbR-like domain-containing protein [Alphaproteobacteria bacterium]|nr:YbbR-like domain-containing protein [Alphaproteobacteria bacterium]
MRSEARLLAQLREGLRRALFRNLFYKLAALVLALGVWGWVQGEQVVEDSAWVQVKFETSEDYALTEVPIGRVRITVSGAQAYVKELRRRQPQIQVDLTPFPAGEHVVDFREYEVLDLPPGVRIVGLVPPSVEIALEAQVTRPLPLQPAQVGEPAEGYRVKSIRLEPEVVEVQGPASVVGALTEGLPTEGIVVTGLKEDTERVVEVPLKNASLSRVDHTPVKARIEIEPVTGTRVFEGVPVLSRARGWEPTTPELEVAVEVKGPIKVIDGMQGDALTVMVLIPEGTPERQITVRNDALDAARYEVVGLPDGVSVEATRPSSFTMEPPK